MRLGPPMGLVAALAGTAPATAEIRHDFGRLAVTANGGVSLQGAVFDAAARASDTDTDGNIDAYGSIDLAFTSDSGLIVGAFASGDTADNRPDTLKNDRLFGYFASPYGRLEVGLTSGLARRMSFYAPVTGSGQVRGDFARYAGQSALLWPVDSRQAFKISWFSAPVAGLRVGVSWAPEVRRFATVQHDVVEFGAQFEQPAGGGWVLGASGAYVKGRAVRPARLEDIESWSLGAQARKGKLVLGGAYVDRADSNVVGIDLDQHEINLGAAWREEKWVAAISAARTRSRFTDNDLIGFGGSYSFGRHVTLMTDLVGMRTRTPGNGAHTGFVLVSSVDFHF